MTDTNDTSPVLDIHKVEQARYAPHLLLIKLTERLDEAMASGRNPYPAYCAWQSALDAWAEEDPIFLREAAKLNANYREACRIYGGVPVIEYVRAWRRLYFGVMRRAGMFDLNPSLRGQLSSTAQRLLREQGPQEGTEPPHDGGRAND